MVDVIIPTLWLAKPILNESILMLLNDKEVNNIIIIDNASKNRIGLPVNKIAKIILFNNLKNNFVNPSWNLGIEISSAEKFLLLNDDVLLPENFVSALSPFLKKDFGIVGCNINNFVNISNPKRFVENNEIKVSICRKRDVGFGFFIGGHKSSYYKIPEELKIWCGDDYLFEKNKLNGKSNLLVENIKIKGLESVSSNSRKSFFDIRRNDLLKYKEMKL